MRKDTPIVVAFVGLKNSGKTTVLVQVVERLKARGYTVGTIKHTHHHDVRVDQPGKDSHRHYEAGADTVIIASDVQCAMIKRVQQPPSADAVVDSYLSDMDFVLVEGYKTRAFAKVEVFRRAVSEEPLQLGEGRIALVTDDDVDVGVPVVGFDELDKLTDLIVSEYGHRRTAEDV
jgi:molybdopterin-guanine dinucleotide biosynthesis protein MobB